MNPLTRFKRRGSRGQGLVEFALIIPLFLLLLMALFDLGRAVFTYNSITNAAREGARLAIVNQDPAKVTTRAVNQSAMAETGSPNVTVKYFKVTPNADYTTNEECTGSGATYLTTSKVKLDCVAWVQFQATYQPITPIISSILFKNGVTFTASSIEQIEFVCPNSAVTASNNCPKQP
jgi:Flp pilus assembly protein TadG